MISRLDLARQLFNYNPNTTPHETLEAVRIEMASAFDKIDVLHGRMETVNHDAIYKYYCEFFFEERPIQRKTPQRIVLEPEFEGETKRHLPRRQLESGEFIESQGDVFVFGFALREKQHQYAEHIKSDVAGLILAEMEIEEAIARGEELVLRWEQWRILNSCWTRLSQRTKLESAYDKVDWRTEGF